MKNKIYNHFARNKTNLFNVLSLMKQVHNCYFYHGNSKQYDTIWMRCSAKKKHFYFIISLLYVCFCIKRNDDMKAPRDVCFRDLMCLHSDLFDGSTFCLNKNDSITSSIILHAICKPLKLWLIQNNRKKKNENMFIRLPCNVWRPKFKAVFLNK